ncbi:protein phosphatase 2C domain-containing protein [Streptosporangium sp. NPDC023615]|uniref:PP2C family protein-serine/threonine phosphatase n=1 Tax=Streptosporangium sp. NPDC023615 TaxID=3154794 RepID=UPI00342F6D04
MTVIVEAAARTHVGLVRRRNEDAFYAGQSLFAVADGLGGRVAGDIASAAAIEAVRPHDQQNRLTGPTDLFAVLGQAVYDANQALRRTIEADPGLEGMGTTLVAMLWSGSTAVMANVGDSRAYLLRGADARETAELVQITEDHTYGNLVADAGSVPNLPGRIARFLDGRTDGRSPDLTVRELRSGDRILLCSDGLSSFVPHELIQDALRSSTSPDEVADYLIKLAIDQGGHDNVTVIVIDVRNGLD